MVTPNRILLISPAGRYDEAVASGSVYPGQLLAETTDATPKVIAHNVVGGLAMPIVALENALLGGDISQVILTGNVVPFQRCVKGDLMLWQLTNGQNVTAGTRLMSNGDGTLTAAVGSKLYQILANSTTVTNTTTETTFSNGSYAIAANTLSAGDVIHIRGTVTILGQNSTNTHDIKVYLGTTVIFDPGAVALATNAVVTFDIYITIRTAGASGTWESQASGATGSATALTGALGQYVVGSTAIDTTAAQTIKVTTTASATSAGNQDALTQFAIYSEKVSGFNTVVVSAEAINNTSGGTGPNSSAWIRGWVF